MLSRRLALVTGGGSGIGRAVCNKFASEGAKIAVVDRNLEAARETAKALKGPEHNSFEADVSCAKSVSDLMENIRKQFSQIPTIAVNCAGITKDDFMLRMDEQSFDDVISVNLKGTYLVGQAVARGIVENNIGPGSIVNISSIVGKTGNLGQVNYSASKAGVVGMSKTMAKELAQFKIRVNVILPGFIETPMVETVPEKVVEALLKFIPAGRMGKPEEIADACLFLASDKSSYITGTAIEVTGGLHM